MLKIKSRFVIVSAAAALMMTLVPLMASAETASAGPDYGPWRVIDVAKDSNTGHIEAYKVDRDLVAWTLRDDLSGRRYLYAFDGIETRQLATLDISDMQYANSFYDDADGHFDVADGAVVWTQFDGSDLEIFAFRNGRVTRITDNGYDDLHPVTSAGRIAWTSYPGGAYHLMINDRSGTRSLATYHVLNYAFSGANLYWLNKLPNEDWFRVFVNGGSSSVAVGKGDDRAITDYFISDGEGSVAWEYSTKQWSYDKREIFVSNNGAQAVRMLQRDVPPNVTRLEDVRDGMVLVNSYDMLTTRLDDVQLLLSTGYTQSAVVSAVSMTKALFTDDAHVRHVVSENASPLIVRHDDGHETWITLERVAYEVFDADADTIVAAKLENGGVIIYNDRTPVIVPTDAAVRDVATKNDTVAWIEGQPGSSVLSVAVKKVLVGNVGGAKGVTGQLVKSDAKSAVYLVTADARYVFPSEKEFFSWYGDFTSVRTVPAERIAALPLKGIVLYPAGTLLKTPSSSMVYMVGDDGTLHWVTERLVLETLYGQYWKSSIRDIPAAFLASYRYGGNVANMNGYYSISAVR